MKTQKFTRQALKEFFDQHQVATIDELREALGAPARCTLFRKLGELPYLSSYSHRGQYYTLKSIAGFDARGLWRWRSVGFSHFGNLLKTAEALVHGSEAGYSARELKEILQVKTKHALTHLVRQGRIQREAFDSIFVYLSAEERVARRQRKAREVRSAQPSAALMVANPDLATEEAKALLVLFCSLLDERQRRLYAGLESLKLGHGGDAHIGSLLGLDPHTVARGRQELLGGNLSSGRIRAPGGGRRAQEKKRLTS